MQNDVTRWTVSEFEAWWETGYRYARYAYDTLLRGWIWDAIPDGYYDAFSAGVACGLEDR